jgi:hypothetical protein
MKHKAELLVAALLLASLPAAAQTASKPTIVVIMGDDVDWSILAPTIRV